MNAGGIPYKISNPPGSTKGWVGMPGNYSVDFNVNVKGTVEHFDVYGEVRTRYSQVYWTRNTNINLPDALIQRFAGKVMAITGYEIDQVTHSGPQPGTTTKARSLRPCAQAAGRGWISTRRVASRRISSHLLASHRVASRRIASRRIAA